MNLPTFGFVVALSLMLWAEGACSQDSVAEPEAAEAPAEDVAAIRDRLSLANEKYSNGDITGALQEYDAALAEDPSWASGHAGRALARHDLGDFDGALADYDLAISLAPPTRHYQWLNFRGLLKLAMSDTKGGMADYNQAIKLEPASPWAYYNWGCLLYDRGNLDTAVAEFESAAHLEASQDEAGGYFIRDVCALRLWLSHMKQGYPAQATRELAAYTEMRPAQALTNEAGQRIKDIFPTMALYLLDVVTDEDYESEMGTEANSMELCHVRYYQAEKKLLLGDREGALKAFIACIATSRRTLDDFSSAVVGKRRLMEPAPAPPAVVAPTSGQSAGNPWPMGQVALAVTATLAGLLGVSTLVFRPRKVTSAPDVGESGAEGRMEAPAGRFADKRTLMGLAFVAVSLVGVLLFVMNGWQPSSLAQAKPPDQSLASDGGSAAKFQRSDLIGEWSGTTAWMAGTTSLHLAFFEDGTTTWSIGEPEFQKNFPSGVKRKFTLREGSPFWELDFFELETGLPNGGVVNAILLPESSQKVTINLSRAGAARPTAMGKDAEVLSKVMPGSK